MATSNKAMSDMMRGRRKEMMDMPAYMGPPSDEEATEPSDNPTEEAAEPSSKFTVAAPGEPSTGDQFEYEPFLDMPGAWVVYPPGVPCDDTEYRIQMSSPAGPDDFAGMQKALDDAGAASPEPAPAGDMGAEEDGY
jgi:hypothetical protein